MHLNRVSLIGELADDPTVRTQPSGERVTLFTLTTICLWPNAKTKQDRAAVDHHPVVAPGKLGDIVAQYLKKDSKVYVEGRLATSSARHGNPAVVATNLIMLGTRRPTREPATPR